MVLGIALVLVGRGIAQRRRVAYVFATAALAVSAVTHVLEGSFFLEAVLSLALAATLFANRSLFTVPPRPRRLRTMAFAVPSALALAFVYGIAGLFLERGDVRPALTGWLAVREVAARLTGASGPLVIARAVAWLPVSLTIAGVAGLVGAAAYVLAPHREHRRSSSVERAQVTHLLRRRDGDTLDPFALRGDKTYVFSPDGRAAVAYRCVHGVGLASGDPIGDPEAFPSAIDEFVAHCEQRGWRPAFMGVRDALLPVYRAAGFRSHYLGDEAVIEVAGFNLDGRRMRPVRQAYNRTLNFGLVTDILLEGELPAALREQLRAIARRARDGAPERGLSMALDGLLDARYDDCVIVIVREPDGTPLAFQRYVPCRDGRGLSLDAMRREKRGPNGVNERMIVDMVQWAAAHGIDEVSLNFAFFRAWLAGDTTLSALQRAESWLVRRFNPYFQIESLLMFNAKFHPRWVPRHLAYRLLGDLPVVSLAAMSAEALLPFDRRREAPAAVAA